MPTVHSPVRDFTGTVVGVNFADGKGKTDDPNLLSYFRRHGYGIGSAPKNDPDPADDGGRPDDKANKATWAEYAETLGIDVDGLTKPKIIEAVDQHES